LSEKLIVKNFGPIKHVELDINKVSVLIGEQGTGKSALARLLHLFHNQAFLFEDSDKIFQAFDFPFKKNTEIEYFSENYFISYIDGKFKINYKGRHQEFLDKISVLSNKYLVEHDFKVQNEYTSLNEWYLENIGLSVYISAERIILPIIYKMSRIPNVPYIDYLSIVYNQARYKIRELDIPYLHHVKYKLEGDDDKIILDNETLLLHQTSSGFQASIPLGIIVESFASRKEKFKFIIEEPELNLFPATQYELIKYLIERTSSEKNGLFLATHSPYIITSLNNLMYAYQVGQKNPEPVAAIIDKKYWLNPDEVSAYRLLTDGTARNILDDELKQINAGEIDEISRSINDKWDKIADIEFSKA